MAGDSRNDQERIKARPYRKGNGFAGDGNGVDERYKWV
jgi:hypothetical protein